MTTLWEEMFLFLQDQEDQRYHPHNEHQNHYGCQEDDKPAAYDVSTLSRKNSRHKKKNHYSSSNKNSKSKMILAVAKGSSLLPSSSSIDVQHRVPLEILCDHLSPFLDRSTFNNFAMVNKQTYRVLQRHTPPWPRKLVSEDHCCRIRCLVFSSDGTQLASGCTDGVVRSWHVKTGERPPLRGHMYGQAVLAVTFSTCGNYIASSSTDHTIRIFDLQQEEERLRQKRNSEKKRTRLRQGPVQNWDPRGLYDETEGGNSHDADNDQDDDNNEETSVSICISAGHAYCLSFSPDDVFLVSGHHLSEPRRGGGAGGTAAGAARAFPSETISIWDVSTGQLLRAIRGGGMPVSFIDSSAILPCPSSSSWSSQKSVKLVSTSSDDCLKMWNLNHTIHDSTNNSTSISSNSLLRLSRERERSPDNNGRCVRRWFLGSYNTVMPCPKPDDCENIIVASIDEKAPNSFSIWNTADPTNRRSFKNISPYEIRISSNGTKVASVDDFCTVKVWRISDGRLLSTFDGFGWGVGTRSDGIISASSSRQSDLLEPVDSEVDVDVGATSATSGWFNRLSSLSSLDGDGDGDDDNNSTSDDDSDDGSITSRSDEFCSPALGPACISGGIHEIAFAKDDTVAVISRHFNEIYLFST